MSQIVEVSTSRRLFSQPKFLRPNSQSLIPNQNVARDQLVSEPSRRPTRSDGKRSRQVLFAYYFGHRKLGCWKSRRLKSQELRKKHGRGFSPRNLSRLDRKLRDVGVIQSSTGWGKRGRRSTNLHMITRKKLRGWKDFRSLDGKGITLRPIGHTEELILKEKPEKPFGFPRLPESARKSLMETSTKKKPKNKPFSWFDPKNFRPRDQFYDVGYTKRAKDYFHRVKFWNDCQEYRPKEKRKYYSERYPKPRVRENFQDMCRKNREHFKAKFWRLANCVRLRNGMHGHKMVKLFREMGENGFMSWYRKHWRHAWHPLIGYQDMQVESQRKEGEWFLRLYLWVFRRESTGRHEYA